MTAAEVVRLDAVSRRFPPDVQALRDVTLTLHAGEYVAITGTSGSGKSTLLNVLGLLDRPDAGTLILGGEDTAGLDDGAITRLRGLKIGFVFQASHLVAHLTVMENVELGLAYAGVTAPRRAAEARCALENVGLAHRAGAFPATLSGGEKQRAAIARAVARRPLVMLCDEPTGNLDSVNTDTVMDLLEDTRAPEQVLIVVTHDGDVAQRAGQILEMRDGELRSAQSPP